MQHIDWFHFTPTTAIAGGLLIDSAASLFVSAKGDVTFGAPPAGDVDRR